MAPIVVLHLLSHFAASGIGCAVRVRLQHLGQQGFGWHVGGLRGPVDMKQEFSRLGAQVVDFSDPQIGSGSLPKKIRGYVQAHHIRIVHSHSPRTVLTAAAALAGMRETIHLATEHLLYSPADRRLGLIYALLDRFTLYLPDHVIAVSRKMHRQIAALPGIDARRITTIQNAIDCEFYYVPDQREPCRSELGLTPESIAIGYVGRLEKQKRLDLLLEGFRQVLERYPQARLLIVGEGKQRPQLEGVAASLDISHAVIWTGFRQDIPRLLAAMDVYAQPSANEGLPKSTLEAMAAGKPVIATDVGGTAEAVIDGRTGVLIPPGSSLALGTAIADLLDHPERRSTLALTARSHVVREFGLQQMVDAYRHLYEVLASQL
jgi:glycosyltransferase involved in cell wall biosynthesis